MTSHPLTRPGSAAPRAAQQGGATVGSGSSKPTTVLLFLAGLWFLILCDPQWLASQYVGEAILKVPTLLFGLFLLMTLAKRPREWYPPLLAFFLYTAVMLPAAWNPDRAITPTKQLFLYWVLTIGTLTFVKRPKQALPLLAIYFLWQNFWWDANGSVGGRVEWHPTNANFDGFGPQSVICIAGAYYFAMATNKKWVKMLALAVMAGGIVGVIASFARGAALSALAVLGWIWFRSPRKGVSTVIVAGAALLVFLVGGLVYTAERRGGGAIGEGKLSSFFTEMATIGSDEDDTEDDRKVLWNLGIRMWLKHPVFGVGAENFGPWAAENFEVGTTGGAYDENPGRLYDKHIHSTYFQILCEYGTVGSLLFVWLIYDFWKKNKKLRSPDRIAVWAAATNGALDLRQLSLGLECCAVGFFCTAMFYNQIFLPWLWAIFAMNMLLHRLSRPEGRPARNGVRARAA